MSCVEGVESGENNPFQLSVYLETFGCQMNENDSARMMGILKGMNYRRTQDPGQAGLIIINTCSIRDKAEHKVYSLLGRFKELKKTNPRLVIGVAGCVAQQAGVRLFKRAPFIDLVIGPHNIHKLKDLLSEVSQGGHRVIAAAFNGRIADDEYAYNGGAEGPKAFVSIMRGCDNFCSYCIVPYTRGREVSRFSADILAEIEKLSLAGVREITLVGQNVNSYGAKGDASFPELIRMCAGIDGIERLRFMTSHPKDISDELIGLFAAETKLCKHVHLPAQSGSDSVLKAMKRNYTGAQYLLKVERLRAVCPAIAVTTDIIVGFPGETAADFEETLEFINGVRFDNIFSFMYSPRPGTEAAGMAGHINASVKSERLKLLQDRQRQITTEKNAALAGTTVIVLVEGRSKTREGELTGRTQCNRVVNFPSTGLIPDTVKEGTFADVLITDGYANSLRGRVISSDERVEAAQDGRTKGIMPPKGVIPRARRVDRIKESVDAY
ncbi:MAG: tRNA (N6-isopentenyl adenosine(37)-C2)-methylthiotransferase MiaB [Deltaproteobacteria bacterium]|nr:tRNA (N6-isopentenyl adenosine(37)-C2)-methylthiotransferase MiaB [Deltaproteobacteria bacterium]